MHQTNSVYKPARAAGARYRVLFGGASAGKSVFACQDELYRAWTDSRHRILFVRKVARTIRNSQFQLLLDILEATGRRSYCHVKETEMKVVCPGGGEIITAGLDDMEKLKSIQGITRIWVEEASELSYNEKRGEHDFDQLKLRLRGVPADLCPQITLTFNPSSSAAWAIDRFEIDVGEFPPKRGHATSPGGRVYVQHTTYRDNLRFLTREDVREIENLAGSMRMIYAEGLPSIVDEPDQVVNYELVKAARDLEPDENGPQALGVDVGRYGGDPSGWAHYTGNHLHAIVEHQGESTTRVANLLISYMVRHRIPADRVGVDVVGLGAGTADACHERNVEVKEVVSGAAPVEDERAQDSFYTFLNLRAQMWWHLREELGARRLSFAGLSREAYKRLREDLTAPRYRTQADRKIRVESKDDIRKRIGRSTDYGDMAVYGAFVERLPTESEPFVGFA